MAESVLSSAGVQQVVGRSMLAKRLQPLPVQVEVRGYLAGSGWKEHQATQAVCGVKLPAGLKNASRLPQPISTPAAKAAAGEHDENITYDRTVEMLGEQRAAQAPPLAATAVSIWCCSENGTSSARSDWISPEMR